MQSISMQTRRFLLFLLLFVIIGEYVSGQVQVVRPIDTLQANPESIPLSDITLKSAEVMITVKEEIHDLIPAGTIRQLKIKNDAVLATIDRGLFENIDPGDVTKNIRFLEKRKVGLLKERQKIEEQETGLSSVCNSLNSFKNSTIKELARWENTRKVIEADSLNPGVSLKTMETISFLDSTLLLISAKSNSLADILNNTIETGIEIDTHLEKTSALIDAKRSAALLVDHSPFCSLNFRTNYLKEISDSVKLKSTVELVELKNYLASQIGFVFLTMLIFCGLFYFFIQLRKRIVIRESGFGFIYKEKVLKMISNPGSAAILLALFSATIIFTDKPLIFKEISIYIIAFPLIQLLSKLINEKFRFYLYAFGGLIVFYLLLLLVSNESVLYRFLLLFIAVAEIVLLVYLLMHYDRKKKSNEKLKYFIDGFVSLHIGLAVVGMISNITGRITLTEIIIGAVFLNIFSLLVLRATTLIINGLIAIGVDSERGKKINVVRMYGEIIKRKTINLVNILAVIIWVLHTLSNFSLSDSLYNAIGSVFTHKYTVFSTSFSFDSIFIFFLVIYIAVVLANLIRVLLEEDVLIRLSLSKGLPHSLAMVIKYSLVAGGFFLAVSAAGIPVDRITIILGAMSVGIGFGLQSVFNNLVSGFILLFERPIQLGDTVQVGQLTGNVKSIGIRASSIRTFEGAEVIVPNGQLVSNEVINWTLSDQKRRVEIIVGVSYKSDPKQVYHLLIGILNNHMEVLQIPSPLVFFKGLGESSLDFTVFAWIADYNEGLRIKSELLFSIFEVLKENNIEIPFPQHDLHLRSVDGELVFRNADLSKKTD